MDDLYTTHALFIRCVKPNSTLAPRDFAPSLVLTQLRCSGTVEAVQLMATGYPTRIPYDALYARCAPQCHKMDRLSARPRGHSWPGHTTGSSSDRIWRLGAARPTALLPRLTIRATRLTALSPRCDPPPSFPSSSCRYAPQLPQLAVVSIRGRPWPLEPRLFCETLALALGVEEGAYLLGLTRLFLRPGSGQLFEELGGSGLAAAVETLMASGKVQAWARELEARVILQVRPPLSPTHAHIHAHLPHTRAHPSLPCRTPRSPRLRCRHL